ncbi:MAG TPA: RHS repeat-associated core domain-containing protein [Allosphingosinicella sp.]|nr:RHS repeat-associated core domain-containing protein [Allosphingosinicella sp.]
MIGFHDALGRQLSETGPLGTMASQYDLAGRRTRLTWPDAFYVAYDYLVTGEMTAIRENGAASGIGVIATLAYDDLGRRASLTRGNGTVSFYDYDPVSRLDELRLDFAGTARDLTLGFAHNPASQIAATTRSNDLYAWTGHGSGTTSTNADGLNRIAGWVNTLGYDSKGNITSDGTYTYAYSSENLLTSLTNPAGTVQTSSTYAYDPLMRLAVIDSTNSALDVRFGYDGQEMVYEGLSDNRTRRYVHGPGTDEPLVGYLVTPTGTSRLWYHGDERGSIVSLSNDSGTPGGIGKFDEYGIGGTSRFRYTGQYWLGDRDLLYYRARIYDPRLGRFLQPDPIGYDDGMNRYAYVGGDPINFTDPSGLRWQRVCVVNADGGEICGDHWVEDDPGPGTPVSKQNPAAGTGLQTGGPNSNIDEGGQSHPDIVVTGKRPLRAARRSKASLAKRAADCALDQFGVSELIAAGAVAAGQPIPGSKPWVTPGSSRGTSVAGMAADKVFGDARLPRRLPTIVGGPGTGRALAIASTKSVARFAGRAVPIVGWAWLAYDVVSIAVCTARSR